MWWKPNVHFAPLAFNNVSAPPLFSPLLSPFQMRHRIFENQPLLQSGTTCSTEADGDEKAIDEGWGNDRNGKWAAGELPRGGAAMSKLRETAGNCGILRQVAGRRF